MKQTKRQLLTNLLYPCLIFAGLVVLIIIEQGLASPWDRITNALWILGVIAFVFFLCKGFLYLGKYLRMAKKP